MSKISVLVLPSYDEVASAGLSPDIHGFLERDIKNEAISIISFPYKKLMHIPYQNVFDKKYCKVIQENVKADIYIMSKIDHSASKKEFGEKFSLQIRIYNTKTNKQIDSKLKIQEASAKEIEAYLKENMPALVKEIKTTANIR